MADLHEWAAYDLTPGEAAEVKVFREAVRRLTGHVPTVVARVQRVGSGHGSWSDPAVEVDGVGYQGGSTLRSVLSWALWCVAEKACAEEIKRFGYEVCHADKA